MPTAAEPVADHRWKISQGKATFHKENLILSNIYRKPNLCFWNAFVRCLTVIVIKNSPILTFCYKVILWLLFWTLFYKIHIIKLPQENTIATVTHRQHKCFIFITPSSLHSHCCEVEPRSPDCPWSPEAFSQDALDWYTLPRLSHGYELCSSKWTPHSVQFDFWISCMASFHVRTENRLELSQNRIFVWKVTL